jgi:hypothetical protein
MLKCVMRPPAGTPGHTPFSEIQDYNLLYLEKTHLVASTAQMYYYSQALARVKLECLLESYGLWVFIDPVSQFCDAVKKI